MTGVRTLVRLAFAALAVASPALAQSSANALPAQARMHEAWGEKSSTPGTSLTIKEASRSDDGSRFRLYATGVPKGTVFSLIAWPITQRGPSEVMEGIVLDENGQDDNGMALCPGQPDTCGTPDQPNEPLEIPGSPMPGEPVRLGLMSADGALKLYAKLVAVPLRGEDQGCAVEATLLTPGADMIVVEGTGFPAASEIIMDSGAQKEPRVVKGRTDSSGRYLGAVLPYEQGSPSGALKVTLKSSKCSPAVTVPLTN